MATSLAIIIPTSLAACQQHAANRSIDWGMAAMICPPIMIGSFVTASFAAQIDARVFSVVFAIYALYSARRMLKSSEPRVKNGTGNNTKTDQGVWPSVASTTALGLIGGSLSALTGIGGAFYGVPFLSRYIPMPRAIGTVSLLNVPLALAGVAGFVFGSVTPACRDVCLGYVHLPSVAAIGIGGVLAAPVGALFTQKLPIMTLRRLFAVVLIAASINIAVKTLPLAAIPAQAQRIIAQMNVLLVDARPAAAMPPVCLDNQSRRFSLVAEFGPRRLFTVLNENPEPRLVSVAIAMAREEKLPEFRARGTASRQAGSIKLTSLTYAEPSMWNTPAAAIAPLPPMASTTHPCATIPSRNCVETITANVLASTANPEAEAMYDALPVSHTSIIAVPPLPERAPRQKTKPASQGNPKRKIADRLAPLSPSSRQQSGVGHFEPADIIGGGL
jgi:uncharacterized membrane protein YfcA